MKDFFSIVVNHEFDRVDKNTIEPSNHLSIVPADSNSLFIRNERLWFRTQNGLLNCFIEDDEAIKNEVDVLFFWVVCNDPEFFSYTAYPDNIDFLSPYYYWSNSEEHTLLQENDYCALHPGKPPRMAIGCIGISIEKLVNKENFIIEFNTRKTLWTYHIIPKENQLLWTYDIVDESDNHITDKWTFKKTSIINELDSDLEKNKIIFQSTEPIPYFKKASNRFKLKWSPKEESDFEKAQEMILPFANYTYKMVNEDNIELTPVYIYI